jgi:hypothetical protein
LVDLTRRAMETPEVGSSDLNLLEGCDTAWGTLTA